MAITGPLVFVDLETAGADLSRPIIQVAAIAVARDFEELETFEAKLTFDRRLADPKTLTKKRYCEKTWQAEARSATIVAQEFAGFLRRYATLHTDTAGQRCYRVAQLAAHNAPFDGPFLQAWFDRVGAYFPGDYRMLCTLQRAIWLFHEYPSLRRPQDYKLGTLCKYFGIGLPPDQAHTALADVRATVELYRRISLLATAEWANALARQPLARGRRRRVSRVAATGHKTCLSRRRKGLKACRLRRRPHFRARP